MAYTPKSIKGKVEAPVVEEPKPAKKKSVKKEEK
jgi:hypothetical protein